MCFFDSVSAIGCVVLCESVDTFPIISSVPTFVGSVAQAVAGGSVSRSVFCVKIISVFCVLHVRVGSAWG